MTLTKEALEKLSTLKGIQKEAGLYAKLQEYRKSQKLTPQEAMALRQKYDIDPDANLQARDIGRRIVGWQTGSGLGNFAQNMGAAASDLSRGVQVRSPGRALAGSLLGGAAGLSIAARKYSKDAGRQAVQDRKAYTKYD